MPIRIVYEFSRCFKTHHMRKFTSCGTFTANYHRLRITCTIRNLYFDNIVLHVPSITDVTRKFLVFLAFYLSNLIDLRQSGSHNKKLQKLLLDALIDELFAVSGQQTIPLTPLHGKYLTLLSEQGFSHSCCFLQTPSCWVILMKQLSPRDIAKKYFAIASKILRIKTSWYLHFQQDLEPNHRI